MIKQGIRRFVIKFGNKIFIKLIECDKRVNIRPPTPTAIVSADPAKVELALVVPYVVVSVEHRLEADLARDRKL